MKIQRCLLIAGFLQCGFATVHAGMPAERPEIISTKITGDSLFIVSSGTTTATVIDSKNQFYIVNGTPDKNGRIFIRFNGTVRGMTPGNRINFNDENNSRKYFVYKGIENGQFVFFLQAEGFTTRPWTGTSAPTAGSNAPNTGSTPASPPEITGVRGAPNTTATPGLWLSLKSFTVFPGTTSASVIDSKNQFFIAKGTPDQHGRITIRFNGTTRNMAPGNRLVYTNDLNSRNYFVYKGIESGRFVFYVHDYTVPEPEWTGTTAPDTTHVDPPLKRFAISPGTTSASLIDKLNQFYVKDGNPDQYGRISVRFNGSEHNMAPGNRILYADDTNKRFYFVYKGIEKTQFIFYTQIYK
jgi:hypothetical protein